MISQSKLVVLLVVGLLAPGWLWAETRQLVIAYENKEQPPYYMGDTYEVLPEYPGVAVEMVQLLETKISNISITLVRAPWGRCLSGLASNQYDGIFNASYLSDRLEIGWYPTLDGTHTGEVDSSKRITGIRYSLYRRADSSLSWDGEAFQGSAEALQSLGAPRGYSIVQDLKQRGLSVQEVPGTSNAMLMLLLGRLEGAVLQDVTADAFLSEADDRYQSILKEFPPVEDKDYFLMLSHGLVASDPELAQKIWRSLAEIREIYGEELRKKYEY
ncbi:amino acid ABC transporter substrate-binding protein, PAAT family [Marinospirillum celere]|uniref:Amino acid ABC transporter substrate-binding protein, PAAT family n=2 Tax=Marinospirillum celere TaxID=1122252 RepID=A0A1I1ELF2_9GAMM|nr:amino acid ABC transporter substrate-binding protein, PAAT family [Marinospirillum celere]